MFGLGQTMQADLKAHEYADLFPMMGGSEFESLVRDIAENGLANPTILLHRDGRILDGRNRYAACTRLSVPYQTATYEGDDHAALAHVVSLNLERRQLSTSQRAAIAAEIATLKHGSNQHRKSSNVEDQICSSSPHPNSGVNTKAVGKSRQEAADMVKVSRGSVNAAAKVQRHAPAIHEMVRRDEVRVSAAKLFVENATPEQIAEATTPDHVKAGASAINRSLKERVAANKLVATTPRDILIRLTRTTKELGAIANDLSEHAYLPNHKFSQVSIRQIADRLVACAARFVELTAKE